MILASQCFVSLVILIMCSHSLCYVVVYKLLSKQNDRNCATVPSSLLVVDDFSQSIIQFDDRNCVRLLLLSEFIIIRLLWNFDDYWWWWFFCFFVFVVVVLRTKKVRHQNSLHYWSEYRTYINIGCTVANNLTILCVISQIPADTVCPVEPDASF